MFFYPIRRLYAPNGSAPAGETGAAAGVIAGNPGPRQAETGAPAAREEPSPRRPRKTAPKQQAEPGAAEPSAPREDASGEKPDLSWEAFLRLPENKARMQRTVTERLNRALRESRETLDGLAPVLELLGRRYGISTDENGRYDPRTLAEALRQDAGEPAPSAPSEQALQEHAQRLEREAEELRRVMPGFRLEDAERDPDFRRFTSPEVGLSVKQAVWALHGDEIQAQAVEAVARRARLDAASAIRSGLLPRENGAGAVPAAGAPRLSSMSREDRRAYILQKFRPDA